MSLGSLPDLSFLQGVLNLQSLFLLQYISFSFLWHRSSPLDLPFLWPHWVKLIVLLVVYIKPKTNDESLQISIQMHWDRLHTFNSTAVPLTSLQEGLHPRSLLHRQKKTFSMTLLATYSPSFLRGLVRFRAWIWPSPQTADPGNQIYLHLCLLCHCWSRTPLGRGGCKRTLQIMHKILRYAFVTLLSQIKQNAWAQAYEDD